MNWLKDRTFINRLLFNPPNPPTYNENSFPGELIFIKAQLEKGTYPCLQLWKEEYTICLLFFKGNGGDLGSYIHKLRQMHETLKVNILCVEYPGFGICSRRMCNESVCYEAAESVWNYAVVNKKVLPQNIIIFGFSIGGGIATHLVESKIASNEIPRALVLYATFTCIKDIAAHHFGPLARIFVAQRFNNIERVKKLPSNFPVLIFHGDQDTVIPSEHSERLFEHCSSKKKKFILHRDGKHKIMNHVNLASKMKMYLK